MNRKMTESKSLNSLTESRSTSPTKMKKTVEWEDWQVVSVGIHDEFWNHHHHHHHHHHHQHRLHHHHPPPPPRPPPLHHQQHRSHRHQSSTHHQRPISHNASISPPLPNRHIDSTVAHPLSLIKRTHTERTNDPVWLLTYTCTIFFSMW